MEPAEDHLNNKVRLLMKLRSSGITDMRVLEVIESVPREQFIPRMFVEKAYEDLALPIESGQTISQPTVVAWMTAALDIHERHRVLEIGTGSGYQASVLSHLARRVYTIERHKELLQLAEERFEMLDLRNMTTRAGDGTKGWPEAAPFERIMVTAAAGEIPAALLEQLAPGGVMVVPVGDPVTEQILLRLQKSEDGEDIETQHLMNVRFVPLIEGKIPEYEYTCKQDLE